MESAYMAENQFYSTEQSGEGSDSHRSKKYVQGLKTFLKRLEFEVGKS